MVLYRWYKNWRDAYTPETGSISPKTGRTVEEQRVNNGPAICVALVRWIGQL